MEQEVEPRETAKIKLSRHDNHNVELKSSFYFLDKKIKADLDLFLFVPQTVHLSSWSKSEITSDFFSRQRLSVPQSEDLKKEDGLLKIHHLRETIANLPLCKNSVESTILTNELLVLCRSLGAYLGENIKFSLRRISKELLVLHSRIQKTPTFESGYNHLFEKLEKIKVLVEELRGVTNSDAALKIPVVQLLEQYIHHLFVESLAKLKEDHERLKISFPQFSSLKFRIDRDAFGEKIKSLLREEAYYQKKHHSSEPLTEKSQTELLIVRLGQMKKFFQSEMFINVSKRQTLARFVEPASALAAAFAALIYGVAQYYSQPGALGYSLGGMYLILIWVALYVIRDRLKDHGKAYLTEKISGFLPDAEENLDAENHNIGKIKEWFRIFPDTQVSEKIQQIRESACVSEAEHFLPEDVIHFKRSFTLWGLDSVGGARLSLQENLRINLERYLKFLDDPQKEICVLNDQGEFSRITSNKVYYFYLVVNLSFGNDPEKDKSEIYRIILNKHGIQKVLLANHSRGLTAHMSLLSEEEVKLVQEENQRSLAHP